MSIKWFGRLFPQANGFQSQTACGNPQVNSNTNNPAGSLITVILPTKEEGTEYNRPSGCNFFAFGQDGRVRIDQPQLGYNLGFERSEPITDGLEVFANRSGFPSEHAVRLAGNPPTYTAGTLTLSIVIAYDGRGPAAHVIDTFLRTVYVVFPGVEKLEAVLQTPAGSAITKPLTVYTGETDGDTPAKVVATVKASGGEGDDYSYDGTALGNTDPLDLDSSDGKISIPAGVVAVTTPGTNFQLEVTVNDTGGDDARRNATPPRKVTLTLQYIQDIGFAGGGIGH